MFGDAVRTPCQVSVSLVRIISGGVGEFVRPSVDDGVAIYVVDAGHNALFELVF